MVTFLHLAGPVNNGFYIHGMIYGVQLFFVISAFSLTYVWSLSSPADSHRVANFFIRRSFRIWPLWWIMVLVGAYKLSASFQTILLNLTFLFGFRFYAGSYELVVGAWSLFVEECFYLLFPFAIAPYIKNFRQALIGTGVFLALSYFWEFYVAASLNLPSDSVFVFRFPLNQFFCFFVGIAIFFLLEKSRQFPARLKRYIFILDLWVIVVVGLGFRFDDMRLTTFGWGLLLLACLFPNSTCRRIAQSKYLRWFGIRCYSIYLIQFFVMDFFIQFLPQVHQLMSIGVPNNFGFNITWYAGCFFLYILVGDFLYRFAEKPYIKLGHYFQKT